MIYDPHITLGVIFHALLTVLLVAVPLMMLIVISGRLGRRTLHVAQEIHERLEGMRHETQGMRNEIQSMRSEMRQASDLSGRIVEVERRMARLEERVSSAET
jgi:hypothetical protein